jgi:FkbM family methyltransferase
VKNIFIDIGAHLGESIEIAIKKKYQFSRIYAIEPSNYCQKFLRKYKDSRIHICQFGFGSENKKVTLFGSGSVGASIYLEKTPYWSTTEIIEVRKFSSWFNENIVEDCKVWIKINVEGAELDIINEIKDVTNRNRIVSILISFDIEKIPSLSCQKSNLVHLLEDELKVPFAERRNGYEVENWLDSFAELNHKLNLSDRIIECLRPNIPLLRNFRRIIKPFIPSKFWLIFALKFGPNRKR